MSLPDHLYIGLVGTNGAGKSSVCAYLKSKGFEVVSLSDIVRETATELGRNQSRESLIQTGNELKQAEGTAVLAKKCLASVRQLKHVVFDSIRHPDESAYLAENGVILLGIDAPIQIRYHRISQRLASTDYVDFETFKRQDELENLGKSSGQFINKTLEMCQTIIHNTENLENLHLQLESWLSHLETNHVPTVR